MLQSQEGRRREAAAAESLLNGAKTGVELEKANVQRWKHAGQPEKLAQARLALNKAKRRVKYLEDQVLSLQYPPRSSPCEAVRRLEANRGVEECKTVEGVEVLDALRKAFRSFCSVNSEEFVVSVDSQKAAEKRLEKNITRLRRALKAFRKWGKEGREEFGYLGSENYIGEQDFFTPGRGTVQDSMHTFFRVWCTSILQAWLQSLQVFDEICPLDGRALDIECEKALREYCRAVVADDQRIKGAK